jgi:hypothetical protein
MNAAPIQKFRRAHWSIENPNHYVRDVSFNEDRSTACTGHLPGNLATLRNLVIGLCALDSISQGKSKRTFYRIARSGRPPPRRSPPPRLHR